MSVIESNIRGLYVRLGRSEPKNISEIIKVWENDLKLIPEDAIPGLFKQVAEEWVVSPANPFPAPKDIKNRYRSKSEQVVNGKCIFCQNGIRSIAELTKTSVEGMYAYKTISVACVCSDGELRRKRESELGRNIMSYRDAMEGMGFLNMRGYRETISNYYTEKGKVIERAEAKRRIQQQEEERASEYRRNKSSGFCESI